jgi:uncharacterized LabA/DUF88 family protein
MNKKVVILIDGQNLFYGLKSMNLLEKHIHWNSLLRSLIEQGEELVRTYWFRPQRILEFGFDGKGIRNRIYYKKFSNYHQSYMAGRLDHVPQHVVDQVEQEALVAESFIREAKAKFAQHEYIYDQICLDYDDIEIVKMGIVKIDPFKQEYNGEKGVDVALAVKMISLSVEQKCDKIILFSGDYDYAEAVRFVKSNMTKISIVKLHRGIPPKSKGMSRDLLVLADKTINLYESQIRDRFLI